MNRRQAIFTTGGIVLAATQQPTKAQTSSLDLSSIQPDMDYALQCTAQVISSLNGLQEGLPLSGSVCNEFLGSGRNVINKLDQLQYLAAVDQFAATNHDALVAPITPQVGQLLEQWATQVGIIPGSLKAHRLSEDGYNILTTYGTAKLHRYLLNGFENTLMSQFPMVGYHGHSRGYRIIRTQAQPNPCQVANQFFALSNVLWVVSGLWGIGFTATFGLCVQCGAAALITATLAGAVGLAGSLVQLIYGC
jgi:hypothetical protein